MPPQIENTKNFEYYKKINEHGASVAIHIRRGDYLNQAKTFGINIPDENYFLNAIEKITEQISNLNNDIKKPKFFFFSNDMNWVKEKIIPKLSKEVDYELLEGNDEKQGYIDFYLISKAKHQIASVGGFCTTAHIFNTNKDKILITPDNINS